MDEIEQIPQASLAPPKQNETPACEPEEEMDIDQNINPPATPPPAGPLKIAIPARRTLIIRIPPRIQDPPIPPAPTAPASGSSKGPYTTLPNSFGLFRIYPGGKPSYIPEFCLPDNFFADGPTFKTHKSHSRAKSAGADVLADPSQLQGPTRTYSGPFSNQSVGHLMDWFYRHGPNLSMVALDHLAKDVILQEGFDPNDFRQFRAAAEAAKLDVYTKAKDSLPNPGSWIIENVSIPLPGEKRPEAEAHKYSGERVFRRDLLVTIEAALNEPDADQLHLFPFEVHWQPPDGPSRRLCHEVYNSDEFINAHTEVCNIAREQNSPYEAVVIGLGLWSDSTQLTQFSSAKLWPVYMFLLNQSKYSRNKPSTSSCHHIAYIPELSDEFKTFYFEIFGIHATDDIRKHCRRDLVHAVYLLFLNPEFIHAYVHGREMKFWDGIIRLWFPRFFIHAMDFPEKILMACIKYISRFPCPICLVEKSKIYCLGMPSDMDVRENHYRVDEPEAIEQARKALFEKRVPLSQEAEYEKLLGGKSRNATRNTFSKALFEHGLDFHKLMLPDAMHEIEIGIVKALIAHLLLLLDQDKFADRVGEFDRRCRMVPTFARDTIRKFAKRLSTVSKLAARDYEDLLQCLLSIIDGLFPPPHDDIVTRLVFELATFHALVKLRVHDVVGTVPALEACTIRLGECFREFCDTTCKAYGISNPPKEDRQKQLELLSLPEPSAAKSKRKPATAPLPASKPQKSSKAKEKRTKKMMFSLNTPKFHLLGHYTSAILRVGTTDNYNSQTVWVANCYD